MREIRFHPEHLKLMDVREYEREKVIPYLALDNLVQYGELSRTLVHDGRLIACVGLVPLWAGVFEAWQISSIYVRFYKIACVKAFRQILEPYAKEFGVRRMQTHSLADDLHDRWMRLMKFECEGTLKSYNRFGDDYRIWRRLWA